VFSLMEINEKKVWICLSTGTNGISTGYFLSVVKEIKEHVAAFVLCPGAQVYWWLRRRGCITEDVNRMIRHCFSLSQQQKVTQSKYLKDLGHAAVDQSDADDIINAAMTQGIYYLTLGLSDKERQVMVAGKAQEASAITYGEAREGAMEAHNFSSSASITTTHSRNEKKRDAKSVASEKTLAKSVYSIDTSKVTEDNTDEERNGLGEGSNNDEKPRTNKKIAIEGMQLLVERKKKAMLFETESMNGSDNDDKNSVKDSKDKEEESRETEDSKEEDREGEGSNEEAEEVEGSKEWAKINKTVNANMALAIAQLNRSLEDKEGRSLDSDKES
jgi:hypothetical protein